MAKAKTNDIPRIVRGNDFTLKVNVKKPVLTMGATTLVDFSLEECTDIRVMLVSQIGNRTEMTFSVSGSTLLVDFQETVASGLYGLEVTGKKDGKDWRYYAQPGELLEIVEPTSGAFIPSTDSEEGYYTVTAEIGVVSISEDIIKEQVNSIVDEKFAGALKYKGTVNVDGDLPTDNKVGDTYVVQTKGTYDGKAMEVGDYLIWNGTSWDGLNGENQVENKEATLSAYDGTTPITVATVDGTDITLKAKGDQNKVDKENGAATNLTVQNKADSSALTIKANGYSGIKIVPRQPYNDLSPRARIMYEGKDSYIDIPTLQSGNDTLALQSQIQPTDTTLSTSSTNPIANSTVKNALDKKVDSSDGKATHLQFYESLLGYPDVSYTLDGRCGFFKPLSLDSGVSDLLNLSIAKEGLGLTLSSTEQTIFNYGNILYSKYTETDYGFTFLMVKPGPASGSKFPIPVSYFAAKLPFCASTTDPNNSYDSDYIALRRDIPTTDKSLSSSSENPIANKAVNSAINNLQEQIEYLVNMHNNLASRLESAMSLISVNVKTDSDFNTAIYCGAKSIVLGADVSTTVTSLENKDIDLNGHTLTFEIGAAEEAIDIQSSKFENGIITTNRPLKLTDCTIDTSQVTDNGSSSEALIYAHGTTTIRSCTITASGSLQCGIVVYSDTNLTVENSTITASWAGITQASKNAGATVTLTDTDITATYEAVMLGSKSDQKMSTLTISGGKYISVESTPIVAVRTNFHIESAQLIAQATTQLYTAYDFENQTELVAQSGAVGYAVALMGTNSTTAFAGTKVIKNCTPQLQAGDSDDTPKYVYYDGEKVVTITIEE